jgi:hypothetical protein
MLGCLRAAMLETHFSAHTLVNMEDRDVLQVEACEQN